MVLNWFSSPSRQEPPPELDLRELQDIHQHVSTRYHQLRVRLALVQALAEGADLMELSRPPLSSDADENPDVLRGELWAIQRGIDQVERESQQAWNAVLDSGLQARVDDLEAELGRLISPVQETEEQQTRLATQRAVLRRVNEGIREHELELEQLERQIQAVARRRDELAGTAVPSHHDAITREAEKWEQVAGLI